MQTRDLAGVFKSYDMTLWKYKSLVIMGYCLVLNNLFDEYSVTHVFFSVAESTKANSLAFFVLVSVLTS